MFPFSIQLPGALWPIVPYPFGIPLIAIPALLLAHFSLKAFRESAAKKRLRNEQRASEERAQLRAKVLAESACLAKIQEVNQLFSFYPVPQHRLFRFKCKSKAEFDRSDFPQKIERILEKEGDALRDLFSKSDCNKKKYTEYLEAVQKATPSWSFENEPLASMEKNLWQDLCLDRPTCWVTVSIEIFYESPHGRNAYRKTKRYTKNDIQEAWKTLEAKKRAANSREARMKAERAKVTPKLRYSILSRDGHRCVSCGARASEGARLHVDHIMPISKGGKTEPDNLQTLCDKCNLGKGDSL